MNNKSAVYLLNRYVKPEFQRDTTKSNSQQEDMSSCSGHIILTLNREAFAFTPKCVVFGGQY